MAIPFNRPELVEALNRLLAVKPAAEHAYEPILQPSIAVAELWNTPYLRYGRPVMIESEANPIAAEFGYIGVRPGANVALQITQLWFGGQSAAAQQAYVRLLTNADVLTVGLVTGVHMAEVAAREVGMLGASVLLAGTHTSATVGLQLGTVRTAANDSKVIDLPPPGIILYGDDPGGLPLLAIVGNTVNQAVRGGWYGTEWPLPG